MEVKSMKKFLTVFVISSILVVGYLKSDQLFKIPRSENNVYPTDISFIGVQYKLVNQTVTNTAVATTPAVIYGIVFSTGANSGDYTVFYDSATSTAGEVFEVVLDTSIYSASNSRVVMFSNPVQTTKGIYATNSAVTFKSTILYRPLW
jgi:hypothetical protein